MRVSTCTALLALGMLVFGRTLVYGCTAKCNCVTADGCPNYSGCQCESAGAGEPAIMAIAPRSNRTAPRSYTLTAFQQSGAAWNDEFTSVPDAWESGVALTEAKLRVNGRDFDGGTYSIRNRSSRTVTAVAVWFERHPEGDHEPILAAQYLDFFFGSAGGIEPGGGLQGLHLRYKTHTTKPIAEIVPVVAYIEFEDGSCAGPDASRYRPILLARRLEAMSFYQSIAPLARSGQLAALDQILARGNPGESEGAGDARLSLNLVRSTGGDQALLAEILRRSSLVIKK
jgi:hypothetical protein